MSDQVEPIHGNKLSGPDGRSVALFDMKDFYAMTFINEGGLETKLRLSYDAMRALVRLYIEDHEANCIFLEDGDLQFAVAK